MAGWDIQAGSPIVISSFIVQGSTLGQVSLKKQRLKNQNQNQNQPTKQKTEAIALTEHCLLSEVSIQETQVFDMAQFWMTGSEIFAQKKQSLRI